MKIAGIIPARWASQRFPGKPLAHIAGQPMLQWVWQQAKKASLLADVLIATDDERIATACASWGATAVMTGEHPSGTDRCHQALQLHQQATGQVFHYVINIQGDEPFIDPAEIDRLAQACVEKQPPLATMAMPFASVQQLHSPNTAKCVVDKDGYALYFSRAVLPAPRGQASAQVLQHYPYLDHVGIYAYSSQALQAIASMPPSQLEQVEGLEMLRWLENGLRILVVPALSTSIAVDEPEDIARVEAALSARS